MSKGVIFSDGAAKKIRNCVRDWEQEGGDYRGKNVAGTPRRKQLWYGLLTADLNASATTVTLNPCDWAGNDNGMANVTAYLKFDQSAYDVTKAHTTGTEVASNCIVPANTIIPFVFDQDDTAYAFGNPIEVITSWCVDTADSKLQCKIRHCWGVWSSAESSSWIDLHTGDTC